MGGINFSFHKETRPGFMTGPQDGAYMKLESSKQFGGSGNVKIYGKGGGLGAVVNKIKGLFGLITGNTVVMRFNDKTYIASAKSLADTVSKFTEAEQKAFFEAGHVGKIDKIMKKKLNAVGVRGINKEITNIQQQTVDALNNKNVKGILVLMAGGQLPQCHVIEVDGKYQLAKQDAPGAKSLQQVIFEKASPEYKKERTGAYDFTPREIKNGWDQIMHHHGNPIRYSGTDFDMEKWEKSVDERLKELKLNDRGEVTA